MGTGWHRNYCDAGTPLPSGLFAQLLLNWILTCFPLVLESAASHVISWWCHDSTTTSHPLIYHGKSSPRGHQLVYFEIKLDQQIHLRRSPNALQPLLDTLSKAKSPKHSQWASAPPVSRCWAALPMLHYLQLLEACHPASVQAGLYKDMCGQKASPHSPSSALTATSGSISTWDTRKMSNNVFLQLIVVHTFPLTDFQGRLVLLHSLQCGAV